ncbi:hypothetical protein [Cellulomonas timonensis]|uniref:hypothetical protein n=1 Tax=Cellulomonas timonensis TaxID=1689271 RepID=UPI0008295AB6|nr:hypothetical protein [Cellulomonas timonensis]
MDVHERELLEFADIFVPRRLSQFLATERWAPRPSRPYQQTWLHDAGDGSRVRAVHVPTDSALIDYAKRLNEAVYDIAAIYDWSLSELAERVASIQADLYFVRVRDASPDGTIPLHLAADVLDSVEKLVKAAANRANNPKASGKGRTSERVKEFLEDDLRMGHTKRGSFIITVAARLQDDRTAGAPELQQDGPDQDAPPEQLAGSTPAEATSQDVAIEASSDDVAPVVDDTAASLDFSRRVMTTLSRALSITQRHLTEGDDYIGFDEAVADGMLAPVVEAVEELSAIAMGGGVEMSFQWAPSLPQQEDVPDTVAFSSEALGRAPRTLERFRRQDEGDDPIDIAGFVVALEREEGDDVDSGEVVIQADVGGSVKKVRAELSGTDYEWAVVAHRQRLPFTVNGRLGKKGNRWAVLGPVTVDTSFLQAWQRRRIEALGGDAPEDIGPPEV